MAGLFVEFKAKLGRPPKYTPKQVLEKFSEYVAERSADPIVIVETEKGIAGQAAIDKDKTKVLPQLLSTRDFCVYLGVGHNWWVQLPEEFSVVKEYIRAYLETYQLKGANAGVFNPNIVARMLGLADKQEVNASVDYKFKFGEQDK